MPMTRHKPEQIVTLLRQIEVAVANGRTTLRACKEAQITAQTFYRSRKEYIGLKLNQAIAFVRQSSVQSLSSKWHRKKQGSG